MTLSVILLAVVACGVVLAFRGITLRTCPEGPRRVAGLLGGGLLTVALGLGGLVFLHGPWGAGGMGRHGMMGDMMGHGPGMMGGPGPARSLGRADLPEPGDPGARVFTRACGTCHALPDPGIHTAAEWSAVVDRMKGHMAAVGRPVPTDAETEDLTIWLARHGRAG